MSKEFTELALELDRESYLWLVEHHPQISDAIEVAVARSKTPDEIRTFVLRRIGAHRLEFARRCEAAARYLGQVGD